MTSIRTLQWALVLAIGAACAPATSSVPVSQMTAPPRDAVSLRAHCTKLAVDQRMACYDQGLLAIMEDQSVAVAIRTLDQLSAIDEAVKREGHMYAHSIGLAAYTTPEQVDAAFRQCLPIFQSGCYHGVIQAYFAQNAGSGGIAAVKPEMVNDLCAPYRNSPDGNWLLFQCVHGVGHGLSQVSNHELKQTLVGCDKLDVFWEREGCYGGAFMENIQQATAPHHLVGRPTAEMDHSTMDHSGMDHAAAPPPRLLDAADPMYPCNSLDDKYQVSCWMMQTSAILAFNKGDFADAARTCNRVHENYRWVCYQSLGRDASAYTLRDFKKAVTLCSYGDPQYQRWCHVGFVKNVIDVDADHRSGVGYCALLEGADDGTACYRAVGEQIATLIPEDPKRASACADVEQAYREVCNTAAGVRSRDSVPAPAMEQANGLPVVSDEGIGAARRGMTIGELRTALSADARIGAVDQYFLVDIDAVPIIAGNDTLYNLLFGAGGTIDDTTRLQVVATTNPRLTTAEGIGPGTLLSDAAAAYGAPTLSYNVNDESREYAEFPRSPYRMVRFRVGPGSDSQTMAGTYPPGNGESHSTTTFTPSARILLLLVDLLDES